ncbi:MAG: hypothetical protein GX539_14870, partial [Candidatus Cloacimonetes bacterium]|nr:hypothetical protein [Candidatus Cloacimonadota bacterium]
MSDPEDDVFDDEALDAWSRAHPEVWHYADDGPEISDHSIERLIDRALERRGGVLRRRKRRRLVTAGLVGGLILAGGTAAAVLTRSGQPQAPETGAICRPSGVEGGGGVVIDPGADPIAECRRRWERGEFEELVGSSGVPELVACIGAAGVINVFPGPVDLCERLGLQPADAELDA